MCIIFDIETGPLPLETIQEKLPPFDKSEIKHPGEFDPAAVKVGNMIDQTKINVKIEKARQAHADAVSSYADNVQRAEKKHWLDIMDRAALSPITGQIVAIGYSGKGAKLDAAINNRSEKELLLFFWKQYEKARAAGRKLIGFNIKEFDVPFICQRSWIHRIDVPASILTPTHYLASTFLDLMDVWRVGSRSRGPAGHGTLDTICKSLGLPGKPD
ncbi:MAG: hypothetical protein AAFP90_17735, partial [Planctomycetota bacterium]